MPDLYLLRHAKSDWTIPGRGDKDRVLAKRGINDAGDMGDYMSRSSYLPDMILCSDASRTRQTLDLVTKNWQQPVEITFSDRIYSGGAQTYFNLIRELPDHCQKAMLIGHNPTIHQLALELAGDGSPNDIMQLSLKYPTCGLAVIRFTSPDWADIGQGDGRLIEFTTPKSTG